MTEIINNIELIILDYQGVLVPEGAKPDNFPADMLKRLIDVCDALKLKLAVITAFEKLPDSFPKEIIVHMASINKVKAAEDIAEDLHLTFDKIMFVADGILDLPLLQKVAFPACPENARDEVKRIVKYKFKSSAGEKLILELIDFIKSHRKIL